jgi:hypothetical protein
VTGLNEFDISNLDHFEGGVGAFGFVMIFPQLHKMYDRRPVKVHLLTELQPLSEATSHLTDLLRPSPLPEKLSDPIDAETYIWVAPLIWLRPDLWDYGTFVREKLKFWVGKDYDPSRYEEEYEGPEDEVSGDEEASDGAGVVNVSAQDVISQRMARRASQEYKDGDNSGY